MFEVGDRVRLIPERAAGHLLDEGKVYLVVRTDRPVSNDLSGATQYVRLEGVDHMGWFVADRFELVESAKEATIYDLKNRVVSAVRAWHSSMGHLDWDVASEQEMAMKDAIEQLLEREKPDPWALLERAQREYRLAHDGSSVPLSLEIADALDWHKKQG